eukprot:jgi/Botrbrau1/21164/Bobra.0061s0057.1
MSTLLPDFNHTLWHLRNSCEHFKVTGPHFAAVDHLHCCAFCLFRVLVNVCFFAVHQLWLFNKRVWYCPPWCYSGAGFKMLKLWPLCRDTILLGCLEAWTTKMGRPGL